MDTNNLILISVDDHIIEPPDLFERHLSPAFAGRAPKIVNIPRPLFNGRTGREPRYHLNLSQAADWTYMGEPLAPLKGYPGVMWERPRRKKRREMEGMF